MKKPSDAAGKAKSGGTRRARRPTFGERKTITLRMTAAFNERMIQHCDSVPTPANTYVVALIESALSRVDPAAKTPKMPESRSEPKVTVSIRMTPELHERMNAYCESTETSANAFVCSLIQKDLRQRGF